MMFYVNQSNAYLKRFVYGRKSIYLLQIDSPYSIQNSFLKKLVVVTSIRIHYLNVYVDRVRNPCGINRDTIIMSNPWGFTYLLW